MTEDKLVQRGLVKAHLAASVIYLLLGVGAGFLFAFQFLQHYPFPGVEIFSPGRIRMVHTNTVAYGFLVNALLGGIYWAIPRLTGQRTLSVKLGWFIFIAWQLVLLCTFFGILFGFAQAVEWGETPIFIDPIVVVGLILVAINFLTPIIKTADKNLYVSLWYFTVAFVWTILVYIMGNYFPQFFVAGSSGAALSGLFIHDLVGLLLTPLGWGLMYYFVPVILKKPIWSHGLSLVGFWGLAFFYPLNGIHHYFYSPIPMYLQYGAVIATIAVELVVTTVIVNFFTTLAGTKGMFRSNMSIRWFYTGMIFYFIVCLQCSFQTTLSFQKIIHFTDWVVGHAHLVMFGVFGFWVFGFTHYLWPKLTGREWYSAKLCEWHYWLSTLGIFLMFLDLLVAGVVQGFLWKSLAPWEESVIASMPFWWIRHFTGVLIFIGQLLFAVNMWKTACARKITTAQAGVTTA